MMKKRNKIGMYLRKHKPWSLSNFNDGYIRSGRFIVYFPSHNRSDKRGYIYRSIVAWEAYHKSMVPKNYDIHHDNRNTLDDSRKNLKKILKVRHTSFHSKLRIHPKVNKICKWCKRDFIVISSRANAKFCSQECHALWQWKYNKFNTRKNPIQTICKLCGGVFHIPRWRMKDNRGKFCSRRCQWDSLKRMNKEGEEK
jgi:hypothetical protein